LRDFAEGSAPGNKVRGDSLRPLEQAEIPRASTNIKTQVFMKYFLKLQGYHCRWGYEITIYPGSIGRAMISSWVTGKYNVPRNYFSIKRNHPAYNNSIKAINLLVSGFR
jgi:hypothetical protein